MSQFFYLQTMRDGKSVIGSFNVNRITRTIGQDNGMVILLDDGHEEVRVRYKREPASGKLVLKNGVPQEESRVREWVVSEIYLDKADSERFLKFMNCEQELLARLEEIKELVSEESITDHLVEG